MSAHWQDSIDVLKRYGAIVDIGQVSKPDRARLARLERKGRVRREECFNYPEPKTRWVWIGEAAAE